jgi:hypothetical protein
MSNIDICCGNIQNVVKKHVNCNADTTNQVSIKKNCFD